MATHSPQSRVVASRVKAENKQGRAGVRSCNASTGLLEASYDTTASFGVSWRCLSFDQSRQCSPEDLFLRYRPRDVSIFSLSSHLPLRLCLARLLLDAQSLPSIDRVLPNDSFSL